MFIKTVCYKDGQCSGIYNNEKLEIAKKQNEFG